MQNPAVAKECKAKSRNRGIYNGCTGPKPVYQELQGKRMKK